MSELPEYHCVRIERPISIDGDLEKPPWREVPPFPPFELSDGSGPARRKTTARACWDDRFLYLAFECLDPDIWGSFTRRDDPIYQEEVVEVFLSVSEDIARYYEFEVSPRNVVFDALVHNPTGSRQEMGVDRGWDCRGLATAVRVWGTLEDRTDTDERWTAEMAIPFSALLGQEGASVKPGDSWRANLYRIDRTPTPEFSAWSPTLNIPPSFHVPQRFGRLVFAEGRPRG